MNEHERQTYIMEEALKSIAFGVFEDGPGRRKTLIIRAQRALERVEQSRRLEREARRLCDEEVVV